MEVAHITLWRHPDGKVRWAAITPYNTDFLAVIKDTVPGRHRAWILKLKLWCVDELYEKTLRSIILNVFGPEHVCSGCWGSGGCPVWDELEVDAKRKRLGRRAVMPPKEKRQEASGTAVEVRIPEDVLCACALLGVRLQATEDEIKVAARRLSRDEHPDLGEEHERKMKHERMVRLNAARDLLLARLGHNGR
jgi:hypothetical protein